MKKVIERIVEGPGAPNENDLWLNGTTLKKFQNGEWIAISGGNSGDGGGDGGGCDCEPVEANPTIEDDDVTTPLEALKVGNNIYSVPLSPMVVEGDINWNNSPITFTPREGAPTFAEAQNQMFRGGVVYFMDYDDDMPYVYLAGYADLELIRFSSKDCVIDWYAYQIIQINGTLSADFHTFTPDDDEMSWSDAKQAFDNGNQIYLNDPNRLTLLVSYYDSEENALITKPYNGAAYSWNGPNQDPVMG